MSERLVTYLNEQEVVSLSQVAVLVDKFVLTHKPVQVISSSPTTTKVRKPVVFPLRSREERECYYCHEVGHVIADCQVRLRNHPPPGHSPTGVGLVNTFSRCMTLMPDVCVSDLPDPSYEPFLLSGMVSLTGDLKDQRTVRILRHGGGAVVHSL